MENEMPKNLARQNLLKKNARLELGLKLNLQKLLM